MLGPTNCSTTPPSLPGDKTGRLRSLRVSSGSPVFGSGTGDIYRKTYTWKADQVRRVDTCYLTDTAPITEDMPDTGTTGYDKTARLQHVNVPNFATTGGWGWGHQYPYNSATVAGRRGNMTSFVADSFGSTISYEYAAGAHRPDLLSAEAAYTQLERRYTYDSLGRVTQIKNVNEWWGATGSTMSFGYTVGTPYRSLTISRQGGEYSATFSYYYDNFQRRVAKYNPVGAADYYYYDLGHQLLEDMGNATTVSTAGPYPLDEYVWLDGRPVAVYRSVLNGSYVRQADFTNSPNSCARNGDPALCDVYFLTTDHIGKPVLALNGARLIVGVGEHDPYGGLNRVEYWLSTPGWSYSSGNEFSQDVITQPGHGMRTSFRIHYSRLDTEPNCFPATGLKDKVIGYGGPGLTTVCGSMGGYKQGDVRSPWCDSGRDAAGLTSYTLQWSAASGNCDPVWASTSCICIPTWTYAGYSMRNYEYQRHQDGTTKWFTPLRFPGQYYDDESGFHENWNRFYNPETGRYLQPEPLLAPVAGSTSVTELNDDEDVPVELWRRYGREGRPEFIFEHAKEGRSAPTYAYAFDNPLKSNDPDGRRLDPDGRQPADVALIHCQWKCGVAVDEAYQTCLGDVGSGRKHPLDGGTGGANEAPRRHRVGDSKGRDGGRNRRAEPRGERATVAR